MKQANPARLAAELRARRADVLLTEHALERINERSSILPSRVREMIASRQAVVLPWRAHERGADRTYHLLYDAAGGQFVVAVLASNAAGDPCSHVVTVLSRTHGVPERSRVRRLRGRALVVQRGRAPGLLGLVPRRGDPCRVAC